MNDAASANASLLVSREQAWNKFASAIRLYVGRGRRYSVKQLSNATGVKDRVIECVLCDPSDVDFRPMPFESALSIAAFLGPEFTAEWLSLASQGAYWMPEADTDSPAKLAADVAEDAARVVRAGIDNHFDPEEKQSLRPVGRHMMAVGARLAMGDAA